MLKKSKLFLNYWSRAKPSASCIEVNMVINKLPSKQHIFYSHIQNRCHLEKKNTLDRFTLNLKSWKLHQTTLMIFNISTWRCKTNKCRVVSALSDAEELISLFAPSFFRTLPHYYFVSFRQTNFHLQSTPTDASLS